MVTATSRAACLTIAALASAVLAAGCGGGAGNSSGKAPSTASPAEFAWLQPATAPAGWRTAAIPSGAAMPYPPGWSVVRGDRGTATAMLLGSGQSVIGYLNVTPRQGAESLSNWARFRVAHNAAEGDRGVRTLAAATRLRFRNGRGSCVRDAYATKTGAHYIEIACLVAGAKTRSVIVGASPPQAWGRISGVLERAISGLTN